MEAIRNQTQTVRPHTINQLNKREGLQQHENVTLIKSKQTSLNDVLTHQINTQEIEDLPGIRFFENLTKSVLEECQH